LIIHFETVNPGTYWIDDLSMSWSYIHRDAVRLRLSNEGDGQLNNNSDNIALMTDGLIIDLISYSNCWGASGNGRTLERIDTYGETADETNWEEGPMVGTPGTVNQASGP